MNNTNSSVPTTSAVPAPYPDVWKVIDRGEHLLTEAMEIPGRGVLVRCSPYLPEAGSGVAMIHLSDVRLEGRDEEGFIVSQHYAVSWKLV